MLMNFISVAAGKTLDINNVFIIYILYYYSSESAKLPVIKNMSQSEKWINWSRKWQKRKKFYLNAVNVLYFYISIMMLQICLFLIKIL